MGRKGRNLHCHKGSGLKILKYESPVPVPGLVVPSSNRQNDRGWRLGDAHDFVLRRRATSLASDSPTVSELYRLFLHEDNAVWSCCGYFPSVKNSMGVIHLRGHILSADGRIDPVAVNTDFRSAMQTLEMIALELGSQRKIVIVGQNERFARRQFECAPDIYGAVGVLEGKSYQSRYAIRY